MMMMMIMLCKSIKELVEEESFKIKYEKIMFFIDEICLGILCGMSPKLPFDDMRLIRPLHLPQYLSHLRNCCNSGSVKQSNNNFRTHLLHILCTSPRPRTFHNSFPCRSSTQACFYQCTLCRNAASRIDNILYPCT